MIGFWVRWISLLTNKWKRDISETRMMMWVRFVKTWSSSTANYLVTRSDVWRRNWQLNLVFSVFTFLLLQTSKTFNPPSFPSPSPPHSVCPFLERQMAFFFFFFPNKFIYLFIYLFLAVLGLRCCTWTLAVASGG